MQNKLWWMKSNSLKSKYLRVLRLYGLLFRMTHMINFCFRENEDILKLQTRTKQLLLLARVREKAGYLSSSLNTLKEARDNQFKILKRLAVDQNATLHEQHKILVKYVWLFCY